MCVKFDISLHTYSIFHTLHTRLPFVVPDILKKKKKFILLAGSVAGSLFL